MEDIPPPANYDVPPAYNHAKEFVEALLKNPDLDYESMVSNHAITHKSTKNLLNFSSDFAYVKNIPKTFAHTTTVPLSARGGPISESPREQIDIFDVNNPENIKTFPTNVRFALKGFKNDHVVFERPHSNSSKGQFYGSTTARDVHDYNVAVDINPALDPDENARFEKYEKKGINFVGRRAKNAHADAVDCEIMNLEHNKDHKWIPERKRIFDVFSISDWEPKAPRIPEPFHPARMNQIFVQVKSCQFKYSSFEPLFGYLFLYDKETNERVSEEFCFDVNPPKLRNDVKTLTKDCEFSKFTMGRRAVFSVHKPSDKYVLVLRVERMHQPGLDSAIQLYSKDELSEKEVGKMQVEFLDTKKHLKMRKYRQVIAWGVRPVFSGGSGNIIAGDGRITLIRPQDTGVDNISTLIEISQNTTIATKNFMNGMCEIFVGNMGAMNFSDFGVTNPCRLNPMGEIMGKAPEIMDDLTEEWAESSLVEYMQNFETAALHSPQCEYVNNLYIYPQTVNTGGFDTSVKSNNMGIKAQLVALKEDGSYEPLKAFYGEKYDELFVDHKYTACNWHEKNPVFFNEIKFRLPPTLNSSHYIILTFINIASSKKKSGTESIIGYSYFNVLGSGLLHSTDVELPICSDLPARLNASEVETKWYKGGAPLFRAKFRLLSSVLSTDPKITKFFNAINTQDESGVCDSVRDIPNAKVEQIVWHFQPLCQLLMGLICVNSVAARDALCAFITLFQNLPMHMNIEQFKDMADSFIRFSLDLPDSPMPRLNSEHLFVALPHQWIDLIMSSDTTLANFGTQSIVFSSYLLQIISKATALYLAKKKRIGKDRKNVFKNISFFVHIHKLLIILQNESCKRHGSLLTVPTAEFFNSLFLILDRGVLMSMMKAFVSGLQPDDNRRVFSAKVEFFRGISDFEFIVQLNLCTFVNMDLVTMKEAPLISGGMCRRPQNYIISLLLDDVKRCLNPQFPADVHKQMLACLRDFMMKLDLDPRYQDPREKAAIADMFMPYLFIAMRQTNLLTADESLQRAAFICFIWILRNCSEGNLREFWEPLSVEREWFFDILLHCVELFGFLSKRNSLKLFPIAAPKVQIPGEPMMTKKEAEVLSGVSEKAGKRSRKSKKLEESDHGDGHHRAASKRKSVLTVKEANAMLSKLLAGKLGAEKEDDTGTSKWPVGFDTKIELACSVEVYLTILETVERYLAFSGPDSHPPEPPFPVLDIIVKIYAKLMSMACTKEFLVRLYRSLRVFFMEYAQFIFLKETNYLSVLVSNALIHCYCGEHTVRAEAAALIYLIVVTNARTKLAVGKDVEGSLDELLMSCGDADIFRETQLQCVISLSTLINEMKRADSINLKCAINTIMAYNEAFNGTAVSLEEWENFQRQRLMQPKKVEKEPPAEEQKEEKKEEEKPTKDKPTEDKVTDEKPAEEKQEEPVEQKEEKLVEEKEDESKIISPRRMVMTSRLATAVSGPLTPRERPDDKKSATTSGPNWRRSVQNVCSVCSSVVLPKDSVAVGGKIIHQNCFRCSHCNVRLALSNFYMNADRFLCKTHYEAIFMRSTTDYVDEEPAVEEPALAPAPDQAVETPDTPVSLAEETPAPAAEPAPLPTTPVPAPAENLSSPEVEKKPAAPRRLSDLPSKSCVSLGATPRCSLPAVGSSRGLAGGRKLGQETFSQGRFRLAQKPARQEKRYIFNPFGDVVLSLTATFGQMLLDNEKLYRYRDDFDTTVDLLHKTALMYKWIPQLHLKWLTWLFEKNEENGFNVEASQTLIAKAAFVAECLSTMNKKKNVTLKYVPQTLADFDKVTCNAMDEYTGHSILDHDTTVVDDEELTEAGLLKIMDKACQALDKACLYEVENELYKMLIPYYEMKRDYKQLQSSHMALAGAFQKIIDANATESRLLGTYYRIGFFGMAFEDLNGKEFIYRELNLTRLAEVQERLVDLYTKFFNGKTEIEIYRDSAAVPEEYTMEEKKARIQITKVEPYFGKEDTTERVEYFDKNYRISQFMFETPFSIDENGNEVRKYQDDMTKQWKKKTVLTTEYTFPFVKRRLIVKQHDTIVLTPIEVATENVALQVSRLAAEIAPGMNASLKSLQQILQGSCLVMVQQGASEGVCRSFLKDTIETWPSAHVLELAKVLTDLLKTIGKAIDLHDKLCPATQRTYHKELNDGYRRMQQDMTPIIQAARAAVSKRTDEEAKGHVPEVHLITAQSKKEEMGPSPSHRPRRSNLGSHRHSVDPKEFKKRLSMGGIESFGPRDATPKRSSVDIGAPILPPTLDIGPPPPPPADIGPPPLPPTTKTKK